jgi:orotate phosphoribosyltransferase
MILDKQTSVKTAKYLLQINAIKLSPENPFSWASGWKSPIYCDNRISLSYPKVRNFLGNQLAFQAKTIYKNKDFIIAGVATGAIGIGMLVAQKLDLPFIYVRPEQKKHGKKNQIEGYMADNSNVVVIEDLISTGKSSLNAVEALRNEGANVLGMLGLFTYGFKVADENFKDSKIHLNTLSDYNSLIKEALNQKLVNSNSLSKLTSWRKSPEKWDFNKSI